MITNRHPESSPKSALARLLVLSSAMFVIGTDGYVVAGLLPEISDATGLTTAAAGQLITVFALAYAVVSPVAASVLGNVERRRLLVISLAVFVAGNAVVAVSEPYPALLVGRVITAIGAAIYTPTALAVAAGLVPGRWRGRSIALVTTGLTLATILGVPLGTMIGAHAGFRGVFWLLAVLGAGMAFVLARSFGSIPAPPAVNLSDRLRTVRAPGVPATLLVSLLVFVAAFTMYSYFADFAHQCAGLPIGRLPVAFLIFGIGGAAGNTLGGVFSDRIGPAATSALSCVGLTISFAAMAFFHRDPVAFFVVTFFWGLFGWLLAPAQQHRLAVVGGPNAPLLISLNSSAMYLGIATSGAAGAILISAAGLGALPWAAAVGAAAALLLVATGYRPAGPRARSTAPAESRPGSS